MGRHENLPENSLVFITGAQTMSGLLYLVILDTISHLLCNEADYLRKRKQLKLPCLLVGHHFRYHQALLGHPDKNISGYSCIPIWANVKMIMTKMKRSHI